MGMLTKKSMDFSEPSFDKTLEWNGFTWWVVGFEIRASSLNSTSKVTLTLEGPITNTKTKNRNWTSLSRPQSKEKLATEFKRVFQLED